MGLLRHLVKYTHVMLDINNLMCLSLQSAPPADAASTDTEVCKETYPDHFPHLLVPPNTIAHVARELSACKALRDVSLEGGVHTRVKSGVCVLCSPAPVQLTRCAASQPGCFLGSDGATCMAQAWMHCTSLRDVNLHGALTRLRMGVREHALWCYNAAHNYTTATHNTQHAQGAKWGRRVPPRLLTLGCIAPTCVT